jgi:hypothetical protein
MRSLHLEQQQYMDRLFLCSFSESPKVTKHTIPQAAPSTSGRVYGADRQTDKKENIEQEQDWL